MARIPDEIMNSESVIDSRDVIARIEHLESIDPEDRDDDERHEYATLTELREAAGGASDWPYGEILVRGSYFEEYAEEMAESIGAISADAPWPTRHIDWKAAADELRQDYTEVEFDGVTYWIRW